MCVFGVWVLCSAQNEADIRRLKSELKRNATTGAAALTAGAAGRSKAQTLAPTVQCSDVDDNHIQLQQQQQQSQHSANHGGTSMEAQSQSELKKLRTENCILRDANKQLEDKNQVRNKTLAIR